MPIRATIVIRTLNEGRHLPDLLSAVAQQTIPPADRETIVVDSGSGDDTLSIARRHECRVIQIAREEFSFGRALNIGCAAAAGRVLVFISGHCVPTSADWLEKLLAPIETGVAALSYGRQRGGHETRFSEHQIFQKYFPDLNGQPPNGFFCNNANAALRRDLWEKYQFDESLTGLEDLNMAKRLVHDGFGVRYVPAAEVLHHHHETWKQVTRRFEREALALQTIMPEIHVGMLTAIRYFSVATVGDWRRARLDGSLLRNVWPIAAYRFSQYYGTWRGNHSHRKMSREARERYFYPHGTTPVQAGGAAPDEGTQRARPRQELQTIRREATTALDTGHAARHP